MMPGPILTTASTIQCPHGGSAKLITANVRVKVAGAHALLETDVHMVTNCLSNSPCTRITWSAGAGRVKVGAKVLVRTSIGTCFNALNAPQGIAIISAVQSKGTAQ